jgi:hypothetical protein
MANNKYIKEGYVNVAKCPECGFVRSVNSVKYNDPNWDKICNACKSKERIKKDFQIGNIFGTWAVINNLWNFFIHLNRFKKLLKI